MTLPELKTNFRDPVKTAISEMLRRFWKELENRLDVRRTPPRPSVDMKER